MQECETIRNKIFLPVLVDILVHNEGQYKVAGSDKGTSWQSFILLGTIPCLANVTCLSVAYRHVIIRNTSGNYSKTCIVIYHWCVIVKPRWRIIFVQSCNIVQGQPSNDESISKSSGRRLKQECKFLRVLELHAAVSSRSSYVFSSWMNIFDECANAFFLKDVGVSKKISE